MKKEKVIVSFIGEDGNIFSLLGLWSKAARRQGWTKEEIYKVKTRVFTASSYEEALSILVEHSEDGD